MGIEIRKSTAALIAALFVVPCIAFSAGTHIAPNLGTDIAPVTVKNSAYHNKLHILPCLEEDSRNCIWDAGKSGNGKGQSFIDYHGKTYYLDECAGMTIPNPCDPDSKN